VSDHPAPVETSEPSGRSRAVAPAVLGLWHRIRAGEDPVAFGAVVAVLALAAGLAWFWAGTRHGGVPAASAAPAPAADGAGPPGASGPPSPGAEPPDRPAPATGPPLSVHVAGAVRRPGLYRLSSGSRVDDALKAAGGSLLRADLDRLNLAAKLVDGQKVLVTRRGDPAPPGAAGVTTGDSSAGGIPGPEEVGEPLDLNTADLAALDALPGIGPATARAILEERTRRGGFRSTRDLLRVPGIGEGRFARLKDRVRV
jgi:competence protein ComEA